MRKERGAFALLFGLLLIPLLGFGGIAVDVGALYSEKAQLQNGADSVALEVAIACAKDESSLGCGSNDPSGLAGGNAVDGDIQSVMVNRDSNVATVTTKSENLGVRHPLASMLPGIGDSTVVRSQGSAEWGVPVYGTLLPFVVGQCELSPSRLASGVEVVVENTNTTNCPGGSPGGFGWLDTLGGSCTVTLGVDYWSHGSTGAWGGNICGTSAGLTGLLNDHLCKTILIPIFDKVAKNPDGTGVPSGTNAYYHITKFAAFVLDGWQQNSGSQNGRCAGVPSIFNTAVVPPATSANNAPKWPKNGFQGHFTHFVDISAAFELGDGDPSGGLSIARLTLRTAS